MKASLRRHRALIYSYTDGGTGGEIAPTYVLEASTASDSKWWVSRATPSGREVTTGMKPEHRIDAVLGIPAAATVSDHSIIVIDDVQYLVRAILTRDHGRDELQVYAEKSLEGGLPVSSSPSMVLARTTVATTAAAGASPAVEYVAITETGGTLAAPSVADNAAWLSATVTGGAAPFVVAITVDGSALAAGAHVGTVTVTIAGALNTPQTITVTHTAT